jgi:hypothetical protein
MSSDEKQAWVQAVVLLGVTGWYFVGILARAQHTPVSEIAYQQALLWNVGIVIAVMIAATIATYVGAHVVARVGDAVAGEIAARGGGAPQRTAAADPDVMGIGRRDERDIGIDRFGGYVGGFVLGVCMLVPLALAMLESDHFWIANTLYAGLVASALVASGVKLVAYRRGLWP